MINYYKVLQVSNFADIEVIKASYKALTKKYHPDLNKGINSKKMVEINEAYEVLKDQSTRQNYDEELRNYLSNISDNDNSLDNEENRAEKHINNQMIKKPFRFRIIISIGITILLAYFTSTFLLLTISRDSQWSYALYPLSAYMIGKLVRFFVGDISYLASTAVSFIVVVLFILPYYLYLFDTLPVLYGDMNLFELMAKSTSELADLLLFSGIIRFLFVLATPSAIWEGIYGD